MPSLQAAFERLGVMPLTTELIFEKRWRRDICALGFRASALEAAAAAGAEVTVFDLSDGQLEQDRQVAARDEILTFFAHRLHPG